MKSVKNTFNQQAMSAAVNSIGSITLNLSEFTGEEIISIMMIIATKNRRIQEAVNHVDFDYVHSIDDADDFLTVDEYLEEKYGY